MSLPPLLVILDLDETLVRATGNPTLDPPDFTLDGFRVRRRPRLAEFLCVVATFADVAVWSSGSDSYVEEIVRQIAPADIAFRFVWGRSRCTRRFDHEHMEEYWVKDLKKVKRLGYSLDRVLIVDDSPEKIERHYGNHIHIEPFYGDLSDRALLQLAAYLERFAHVENVRLVEKRGWHRAKSEESPYGHL
jgi:carboxy-terminal domain RNA polymerase II polypeptide A small phosphatase